MPKSAAKDTNHTYQSDSHMPDGHTYTQDDGSVWRVISCMPNGGHTIYFIRALRISPPYKKAKA